MIPKKLPKGTTLEEWERYEKQVAAHNAAYESSKPHPRDFENENDFNKAYNKWSFEWAVTAPNKPGYFRSNND